MGSVTISGPGITNLDGLKNLKVIGGELQIAGNNLLESVKGLESLDSISGNLKLNSNLF